MIELELLDRAGMAWAQAQVKVCHYLHTRVPAIARPEGYAVHVEGLGRIGCFIVSRTQSTRCGSWYGSVEDVLAGRCEVTRWQILNLARVWLSPQVQRGGSWHSPQWLPGFVDRRGVWRSTLASEAITMLLGRVGHDYCMARPPVFPDQPYEVRWLLSYCDTQLHRGTIYRASGFELAATNGDGIETWRIRLPGLTADQRARVLARSACDLRAKLFRSRDFAERVAKQTGLFEMDGEG